MRKRLLNFIRTDENLISAKLEHKQASQQIEKEDGVHLVDVRGEILAVDLRDDDPSVSSPQALDIHVGSINPLVMFRNRNKKRKNSE